jgi:hypothetical protein
MQAAERVRGACSALRLGRGTTQEVEDLLQQVQTAYADRSWPVQQTTLAAVVYAAARRCDVPITLAAVAGPFHIDGLAVGREFRRVSRNATAPGVHLRAPAPPELQCAGLRGLATAPPERRPSATPHPPHLACLLHCRRLLQRVELSCPPPSMRALVLRFGGLLLPHYCMDTQAGAAAQPQHAVMINALALAELLHGLGTYTGSSHRAAAGELAAGRGGRVQQAGRLPAPPCQQQPPAQAARNGRFSGCRCRRPRASWHPPTRPRPWCALQRPCATCPCWRTTAGPPAACG